PEVLAEALPKLVESIKFDKSMRWNDAGVAFSRPIRWLVALLGETVIPFEYAGVVSGNVTRGLRPYGSPEIEIKSADKYFAVIKNAGILLDTEERKASIVEQVKQAAALVGGEAILDDALLAEVTNLVEMPTAVMGGFDPEFLQLPRDVLISTMKKHQRYFPVERNKSRVEGPKSKVADSSTLDLRPFDRLRTTPSTLLPYFIAVRNGDDFHIDIVREGNEHVLGARFSDADFFVREDLKHKLEDFRPRLGTLIFQKKLGSMLDKSERMSKLADELAHMLSLDEKQTFDLRRATFLAKADLVTKMVVEMTSLQGVMGCEYALRSGESQAVAEAIGEQYQPVPKTKAGLAVALADRLDSLAGLFAAGLAPTGAKDPFGLRRAAIGVLQPLIEQDISFDLRAALKSASALEPIPVSDEIQAQVLEFILGRLRALLIDSGYKYDVVDAVLAAQGHDPARASRAVRQLSAWVSRADWHTILPAYARCVRIIRSAGVSSDQPALSPVEGLSVISDQLLVEKEEKKLYQAIQQSSISHPQSVNEFLDIVVQLIPAINAFFDKVLVMAEDEALRANRLALVGQIANLSNGIADL
ncbi:glycine--tRNA ligase subunit beta, partial [bacterium]|nr:glycine--tRNA ligase subunit beta [bacterium]